VAILSPVFEGESINEIEVIEILKADGDKKFGYTLHKIDNLVYNADEKEFEWEYADGYYTKSRYGAGGYFTVDQIVKKRCKCIPIKKTEDIGEIREYWADQVREVMEGIYEGDY